MRMKQLEKLVYFLFFNYWLESWVYRRSLTLSKGAEIVFEIAPVIPPKIKFSKKSVDFWTMFIIYVYLIVL